MSENERIAVLEAKLGALTARLNALAEGNFEIVAEGHRIGSTRIFEKLTGGLYHLHQRDSSGTENDLTDALSIQGVDVSDTAPTAAQVLVYDATLEEWVPSAPGTPGAHALGGAAHDADTLAHLNTKVSDATLDKVGDSRPPSAHTHDGRYYTEAEHGGVSPQGHHTKYTNNEAIAAVKPQFLVDFGTEINGQEFTP